jgi:hypothetical protein
MRVIRGRLRRTSASTYRSIICRKEIREKAVEVISKKACITNYETSS